MCADNGVVAEGVTQTGQEVTAVVAENFTKKARQVYVRWLKSREWICFRSISGWCLMCPVLQRKNIKLHLVQKI